MNMDNIMVFLIIVITLIGAFGGCLTIDLLGKWVVNRDTSCLKAALFSRLTTILVILPFLLYLTKTPIIKILGIIITTLFYIFIFAIKYFTCWKGNSVTAVRNDILGYSLFCLIAWGGAIMTICIS